MVQDLQCDVVGYNNCQIQKLWESENFELFYFVLVVLKGLIESKILLLLNIYIPLVEPIVSRRKSLETSLCLKPITLNPL